MLDYLSLYNFSIKRGYGTGPSRKMRLINNAMKRLGFSKGAQHDIQRGIYLFTPVKNLREVTNNGKRPKYTDISVGELTNFWKTRWILPREENRKVYKNFVIKEYVEQELRELNT